MRRGFVAVALALSFTLAAFAQPTSFAALRASIAADHPRVPFITASELEALLRGPRGRRPLLLDVRSPAEFAVSHLPGARRANPDASGVGAAGSDRGRAIVVYCSVGVRSADLAERLLAAGFTDVRNLEGGIFQWANTGRPVLRGARTVLEVHPYDAAWGLLLRQDLRAYRPGGSSPR